VLLVLAFGGSGEVVDWAVHMRRLPTEQRADYRAYVRGKVATLLAGDALAEPGARQRAANEARRYFLLALRSASERGAMRALARRYGVSIRFVECQVDPELARVRLLRRERESGVSDGRLAIFDDFCARFEPMTELPAREHTVVRTSNPLAQTLLELRAQVQTWPRGLVA
jgi:hypothetical protein